MNIILKTVAMIALIYGSLLAHHGGGWVNEENICLKPFTTTCCDAKIPGLSEYECPCFEAFYEQNEETCSSVQECDETDASAHSLVFS